MQIPSEKIPYRSLNSYLLETFGEKVYKLALDGGFSCPNRDGTLGSRGCSFCAGGSGAFSVPVGDNVFEAIEEAKYLLAEKSRARHFIAYFQSYTGTYAPMERLRSLYGKVLEHPDIVALSVGTRPDCLPEESLDLLGELNRKKPVWVELGLQTVHEKTAEAIRRGYPLEVYDRAVRELKSRGITVITHMILGLPGESPEQMAETAAYIGRSGADGIKLQLLHVLEGTDLAEDYREGKLHVPDLAEYLEWLKLCVSQLPPDMVIHRLTGDGAKRDLLAPLWSADKKRVLNAISRVFEARPGYVLPTDKRACRKRSYHGNAQSGRSDPLGAADERSAGKGSGDCP